MNSTEIVNPPPVVPTTFIQPEPTTAVTQPPPTQVASPPQSRSPAKPTVAPPVQAPRTPVTGPAPSNAPENPQVAPPVGSATFTFVPGGTRLPSGTTIVNPQGTGIITPNTNSDNSSSGLSGSTVVILSCIGAAIVLAGLAIFAFKYFVARPKKRSEKVELGDAFGKPLSDTVFGESNGSTPKIDQVLEENASSTQYYENGYYNDQYYANEAYYQQEQQYYQPEYSTQNQSEYLVVNNPQYQQQYEPYYEYKPPSTGAEVSDPFADQAAGYTYPTQTRYEAVNQGDPFAPRN